MCEFTGGCGWEHFKCRGAEGEKDHEAVIENQEWYSTHEKGSPAADYW